MTVIALCILGVFPAYEIAADYLGFRVAYHALFLQDYLPSNIVVVLWSLGVEAKFYLIAPILLALIAKVANPRQCFIVALSVLTLSLLARLVWLDHYALPENYSEFFATLRSPFHWCVDGLLLGMLVGKSMTQSKPARLLLLIAFTIVVAGLIAAARSELYADIERIDVLEQPAFIAAAATALLLLAANIPADWNRYFALLSGLGRISYSFYLVHVPLLPSSMWLAVRIGATSFGSFLLLYLLITVIISAMLYAFVERRFYVRMTSLQQRKS